MADLCARSGCFHPDESHINVGVIPDRTAYCCVAGCACEEYVIAPLHEMGRRSFMETLLDAVSAERARQVQLWPDCEHLPDGTGGAGRGTYEGMMKHCCDRAYREGRLTHAHIFEEEVAEVLNATEPGPLREELVQVMAVCAKWIADIDSRG